MPFYFSYRLHQLFLVLFFIVFSISSGYIAYTSPSETTTQSITVPDANKHLILAGLDAIGLPKDKAATQLDINRNKKEEMKYSQYQGSGYISLIFIFLSLICYSIVHFLFFIVKIIKKQTSVITYYKYTDDISGLRQTLFIVLPLIGVLFLKLIKLNQLFYGMSVFIFIFLVAVMWFKHEKNSNKRQGKKKINLCDVLFLPIGASLFVLLTTQFVYFALGINMPDGRLPFSQNTPSLLLVGLVVIFAPIVEEIIFRGLVYDNLRNYFTFTGAAMLTALAFAAPHIQGVAAWPSLLASGIALAFIREQKTNITYCIISHAFNNSLLLTLFLLLTRPVV